MNSTLEKLKLFNLTKGHIPDYMWALIIAYIENRQPPDDEFLDAVLKNDLKETVLYADDNNLQCIVDYVRFFYNNAPAICWGSPEKVAEWIKPTGN